MTLVKASKDVVSKVLAGLDILLHVSRVFHSSLIFETLPSEAIINSSILSLSLLFSNCQSRSSAYALGRMWLHIHQATQTP